MELREVVARLNGFASPSLAETWDNVGLLVEPSPIQTVNKMLITNDLTEAVTAEAIQVKADMIVSYHPPIFQAVKRLTQQTWKERIIIKCIENRIAVYSPHTSYDALKGGVNDWLISPFAGKVEPLKISTDLSFPCGGDCSVAVTVSDGDVSDIEQQLYNVAGVILRGRTKLDGMSAFRLLMNMTEKSLPDVTSVFQKFDGVCETMEIVKLTKHPLLGHGVGRLARLDMPLSIRHCVELVKSHLSLTHVRLALACGKNLDDPTVSSVAVCAGSGSTVLAGVHADLFVTGEMSHHDVLNANHCGATVVLCEHSNTERGFLGTLQQRFESLFDSRVEILLSAVDRDPLEIV
jgi:dinuclear metal center YbgI/SA1388 family protein